MKYKVCLESEYADDFEPDWEIVCEPDWLGYELKEYCDHLYSNCDGWEWMKNSSDRIIAIDESGKVSYYSFEVDYEPVFYVSEARDENA
jgi:hypothetical protein